jgi:hypothetical protein
VPDQAVTVAPSGSRTFAVNVLAGGGVNLVKIGLQLVVLETLVLFPHPEALSLVVFFRLDHKISSEMLHWIEMVSSACGAISACD